MEHLVPGPGTRPRDRQTAAPQPASPVPRRPAPDATSLSDFLGGRALAWLGGIATLIGIVLLLGLAISHEWIGPAVRVILAGAGSAALLADGAWLHAHRGRTEAAVAMVGAATAGAFATLVVAGDLYRLIPAAAAVVGAMLVGAVATALAIRWAGRAIAVLGLIGALLSPVLVVFGSIGLAGAVFTQVRGSAEKHALHLALALVLFERDDRRRRRQTRVRHDRRGAVARGDRDHPRHARTLAPAPDRDHPRHARTLAPAPDRDHPRTLDGAGPGSRSPWPSPTSPSP